MAAGDGDPGRDLGRGEDRADVAADGLGGHGRGQGGLHQVTDVGQVRYDRVGHPSADCAIHNRVAELQSGEVSGAGPRVDAGDDEQTRERQERQARGVAPGHCSRSTSRVGVHCRYRAASRRHTASA